MHERDIGSTGLVLVEVDGVPAFMDWQLSGGLLFGQMLAETIAEGQWCFGCLVPRGTSKRRAERFKTGGLVGLQSSFVAAGTVIVNALEAHAPSAFVAEDRIISSSYPVFAARRRAGTLTVGEDVYETSDSSTATIESVVEDLRSADACFMLNCAVAPAGESFELRVSSSREFILETAREAVLVLVRAYDGESFLVARRRSAH